MYTAKKSFLPSALAVAALLLVSGCAMRLRPPTTPSAYERAQSGAAGLYRASFSPAESIKVGRLHSWQLAVSAVDGTPANDVVVTVDGRMPQHGHGLPTQPVVSRDNANGLVAEGMQFNMGGWWVVQLHITGAKGSDIVTFNLKL